MLTSDRKTIAGYEADRAVLQGRLEKLTSKKITHFEPGVGRHELGSTSQEIDDLRSRIAMVDAQISAWSKLKS